MEQEQEAGSGVEQEQEMRAGAAVRVVAQVQFSADNRSRRQIGNKLRELGLIQSIKEVRIGQLIMSGLSIDFLSTSSPLSRSPRSP